MPPVRRKLDPPMPGIEEPEVVEPGQIPRPRNAWIIFRNENMKEVQSQPGKSRLSQGDLSTALGAIWRNMDPLERAVYEKKAKEEAAAHKRKFPNYKYQPKKKEDKLRLAAQKKAAASADKQSKTPPAKQGRRSVSRTDPVTATTLVAPPASVTFARHSPYYIPDMRGYHFSAQPPPGAVDDRAPSPSPFFDSGAPTSSVASASTVTSSFSQFDTSSYGWNFQDQADDNAIQFFDAVPASDEGSQIGLNTYSCAEPEYDQYTNWAGMHGESSAQASGNSLEVYSIPEFDLSQYNYELAIEIGDLPPADEPNFLPPDFNAPDYSLGLFAFHEAPAAPPQSMPFMNGFNVDDFMQFPLDGIDFSSDIATPLPLVDTSVVPVVEPYVPPAGAGNHNRRVAGSFKKNNLFMPA